MSRRSHIPDAERTATMLDLLHREYPAGGMSMSHVVVEEVAPGTGFRFAQRWADVLVLGVWPSSGLILDGYEIKASRADLKKELADPSKHQAIARYCDHWTLVAWDESVLCDGIPESWGILLTVDGSNGRELKHHRRAEKRQPEPWPREFVCSLVRNAHMQAPGAAYVARAVTAAHASGMKDGRHIERGDAMHALKPLLAALYGKEEWRWPKIDLTKVAALATERLEQMPLEKTG